LKPIHQLKKHDEIVNTVTKPDKGSAVFIMDKDEYLCLLAYINDVTKFRVVDPEAEVLSPSPSEREGTRITCLMNPA